MAEKNPQDPKSAHTNFLPRSRTMLALEPRMMFDAAGVAAVVDANHQVDDASSLSSCIQADRNLMAAIEMAVPPAGGESLYHTDTLKAVNPYQDEHQAVDERASSAPELSVSNPSSRIVFIDPRVPDYLALAADLSKNARVFVLSPEKDGIEQISSALSECSNVDSISIVSHAVDGNLRIGNGIVDTDALKTRSGEIAEWNASLNPGADILLYGCNLARTETGRAFVDTLSALTGKDVAASSDETGSEALGGNWNLEYQRGQIESSLPVSRSGLEGVSGLLSSSTPINLSGKDGWITIMYGANRDPQGDSQAGAADTDIVGDATHGSLYTAYEDYGTTTIADDFLVFRMRIDNPTSSTKFSGVALVGMDANLDGRVDIFMSVDGRNNGQAVRLFDPGNGANISPSTTSTSPLPTGWIPSNGVYPFSASNYLVVAVSAANDPHWNGDTDLGNDGKTDVFVNWKIPVPDLAAVLAKPSPADRSGVVGPRGTTGIQGFNKDTVVQYINFTQTQTGPINGDLNGVGASYDKNATFASLGAFTPPMSPSNPVSTADAVSINDPVDANGIINATEDNAVTFTGTATANGWVKLVISDANGGTPDVTRWVQANGSGVWTSGAVNLEGMAEGSVTVSAQLVTGNNIDTVVTGSTGDNATVQHDSLPPLIDVAPVATGKPVISGTSTDVPVGSTITVGVDLDGNSTIDLTYAAIVASGGAWSVNTATVTPSTGTLPSAGISSTAKVTATGSDLAGNSASASGIIRPTVTALTTNDTTPTITGTWGGTNGGTDSLTVRVNGVDYTTGGGNLTINGNEWSLTIPGGNALNTGGSPYEVLATVSRTGGGTATDTSSTELALVSGPSVAISGIADSTDTTPVINGTSSESYVTVRIDPNNDGNLADAVTYSVAVAGGNWSLNTGTAAPISGVLPSGGLTGTFDVLATATDSTSNQATANSDFTIVAPQITISTVTGANSGAGFLGDNILNDAEDDSVIISGTSSNLDGQQITVSVTDGTLTKTLTPTVQAGGAWTVTFDAGNALSGLSDGSLTVTASKNATTDTMIVGHDTTHPEIRLTTPTILSKSDPVITGVSDLPAGSVLTVTIIDNSDGSTFATGTTTVQADGSWSWQANAGNWPVKPERVTITVTSAASDSAGNSSGSVTYALQEVSNGNNFTAPTVTISSITGVSAGDSVITTPDIAGGMTISGTSSVANDTATVIVSDANATTLTFTPGTNGTGGWTASLTKVQVEGFDNGTLTISASVNNADGTATDVEIPLLSLTNGVGQSVAIDSPIGDGNLSASEDGPGLTISGTATNAVGQTVSLTITDGTLTVGPYTATVAQDSTWSVSTVDLSTLGNGTLTATAALGGLNATQTVLHDKAAPVISITSGPTTSDSTPVISGTTDLLPGATLTIAIDADNNGSTDVTYSATVQLNYSWSVNTETAAPASGSFPASGLGASSKVTVSGTDAAGNSGSVVADSISSITTDSGLLSGDFITSDQTLVFTGMAETGSTVVVKVDGGQIGLSQIADGSRNWSLDNTVNTIAEGTHTLTVIATNGSGNTATATQSFTIDKTAPAVAITGITNDSSVGGDFVTTDTTLVFNGTAEAGSSVLVTLKDSSNATVFSTTVTATGGAWSVDRSESTLADGTYTLSATATDTAGNQAVTTQTVVVDTSATIALTTNPKTTDTTPVITGTTDIEAGRSITVEIDPNNDGNWADKQTYTATVQAGGTWSVEATTPVSGTVGVRATGTDLAGNSFTTATKSLTIDPVSPMLDTAEPPTGVGIDSIANAAEDNSITISGTSTNISDNAIIRLTVTDGQTSVTDSTTVTGNAWSFAAFDLSGLKDGNISINATYMDQGGNIFLDTASFTHDKTPPVAVLSAASSSITAPATVAVTFAEAVTGLQLADFATSNGATLSNLAGAGTTYTLTLTPASNGSASIWMPAPGGAFDGVTDAAGNASILSNTLTFSVSGQGAGDTTAPTVISIVRQTPATEITSADSLVYRVTFSEAVQNVGTNDFTVTGAGSAGASIGGVAGSGSVYDVTVTGIASNSGLVNLDFVGVPTILDTSNNALSNITPGFEETYTLDNTAPVLSGNSISYNQITLSYTETGSGLADIIPATSAFSVTKNGGTPVGVNGVSVNTVSKTVTISLDSSVSSTDTVSLTYTAPGAGYIQDGAGNKAANFTQALTNSTPVADTNAPVIDLDPSSGATVDLSVTSANGALVSLDDNADQATLVEASDKLGKVTITVGGLLNGVDEKLVFGATTVAANGSTGVQTAITVGGVSVDVNYSGGVFTLTKADFTTFTTAEAQSLMRDIQYRNNAAAVTTGDRTFAFRAVDDSGNTSAAATATVNVSANNGGGGGVTPPVVPPEPDPTQSVSVDSMTKDTGVSGNDFITSDGSGPRTVSGSISAPLGANEIVQVSFDGGSTWSNASVSGTSWSATDGGSHSGDWTIIAKVTNSATGVSGGSSSMGVTLDNVAPEPPAVNILTTSDKTPVITGTAVLGSGEVLSVEVNGVRYTAGDGNLSVGGGSWSLVIPDANAIAKGSYNVRAVVTDAAGNFATDSSADELTIMDGPAQTAAISSMTKDSGVSGSDFITSDGSSNRTVSGTISAPLEANEIVQVSFDNGVTWVTASVSGTSWSAVDGSSHASGWTMLARVTNTVLGVSGASAMQSVILDTAPPAAPTVNAINTTDANPVITGSAVLESGDVLTVEVGGVTYTAGDGKLSVSGNAWTLVLPASNVFSPGTYSVNARIIDAAGNSSSDSTSGEIVITSPDDSDSSGSSGSSTGGGGGSSGGTGGSSGSGSDSGSGSGSDSGSGSSSGSSGSSDSSGGGGSSSGTGSGSTDGGSTDSGSSGGTDSSSGSQGSSNPGTSSNTGSTNGTNEGSGSSSGEGSSSGQSGNTGSYSGTGSSGSNYGSYGSFMQQTGQTGSSTQYFTGFGYGNQDGFGGAGQSQQYGTRPPSVRLLASSGSGDTGGSSLTAVIDPADQISHVGDSKRFSLPDGTFLHTDSSATVTLSATLSNGSPLPSWIVFDDTTGSFEIKPPRGAKGTITIRVVAKDSRGAKAEVRFQIKIQEPDRPVGLKSPDSGRASAETSVLSIVDGDQVVMEPYDASRQDAGLHFGQDTSFGKPSLASQIRAAAGKTGLSGNVDKLIKTVIYRT